MSARIAVISDIHGNLSALEAVAKDLGALAPDQVVVGGDLASSGSRPADVIDFIRSAGWPVVAGNTDEMLWRPDLLAELQHRRPSRAGLRQVLFEQIAPFTRDLIGPQRLAWLAHLPRVWAGEGLAVVHATADDLWSAPLATASDEELLGAYRALGQLTTIYGHLHRPFVRRIGKHIIANAGSVSLSYDGDPRASYCILDDDSDVSIRRVEYDRQPEVIRLREMSYPCAAWISKILLRGEYQPPHTVDNE